MNQFFYVALGCGVAGTALFALARNDRFTTAFPFGDITASACAFVSWVAAALALVLGIVFTIMAKM